MQKQGPTGVPQGEEQHTVVNSDIADFSMNCTGFSYSYAICMLSIKTMW